jgi:malate permease and related proteins
MSQIYIVVIKALPVILLILLGIFLRQSGLIKKTTVDDLKKIVVNIALPSTLFLTFAGTTFQSNYLWIFLCVFSVCLLMLLIGIGLKRIVSPDNKYYPALFAGFEAGMMGYALFTSFFGAQNTYKFAIIDVGQVVFVFFILVAFLQRQSGEKASYMKLIKSFILSPIILAIILGIFAGSTGIFKAATSYPITGAFTDTLKLLGSMTQPLICIVIGYELHMQAKNIVKPLITVLLRMCILLGIAFLLNTFLIDKALHLDKSFALAVYTMFLLPPPFVIPIYMGESSEKQTPMILNTISLHVLFSLTAFMVLVSIM